MVTKYSIRVGFGQDRKVLHILKGSPSTPKSIAGIDLPVILFLTFVALATDSSCGTEK